jgi:hypothetical protein
LRAVSIDGAQLAASVRRSGTAAPLNPDAALRQD